MEKDNILYVDDEIDNLNGFNASFSRKYNVYISENTVDAQKHLNSHEIKVILIDYKMPEEDGISFAIKMEKDYPYAIKILVTAYAETEVAINAVNSHSFYAFIPKPWNHLQLQLTIKNAIDKYNMAKQNRELLSSLQKSLDNEKRSNYVKDAFLKNISHEVRTPLSGIMGFSDLIMVKAKYPELQDKLDFIVQSSKRLLHTMQSIIESATIVAHDLKFNGKDFNLKSVIHEIINESNDKYHSLGNYIAFTGTLDNLECLNDAIKVKVILERIIDNAFKYSIPTSPILINVDSSKENDLYTIKVKNKGNKIKKEDYDNIFESFMNIDNSLNRTHEGIGLGLYIAKSYAEFLGGKVWIEEADDSNVFCVTIKKRYSVN